MTGARPLSLFVLGLMTLAPRSLWACTDEPWSHLDRRLARIAEPLPLLLLAGAGAAPAVFAPTGVDQDVRVFAQRDLGGKYDAESITPTVPYAVAGALAVGFLASELAHDCNDAALTGRALIAVGVSVSLVSLLKITVGRTYLAGPTGTADRLEDDGRSRQFLPFQNFGAWPSGHSATTFAFAAALRSALPRRVGFIRYAGYALATFVTVGMAYGDHHWASDLLSGALFGEVIGNAVGAPLDGAAKATATWEIIPTATGAAIVGAF